MKALRPGRDYIGVGVGAVVFNDKQEVFLSLRGPNATNEAGTWEFPGGKVDFGETLETAIVREFFEEYGMVIELRGLLTVADHILPEEQQHWVSPTFLGKHLSGQPEIREPAKCAGIGWFALNELPEPLSAVTQTDIQALLARGIG